MFGIARSGVPGRRGGLRGWESGQKGKPITQSAWEAAGRRDELSILVHNSERFFDCR
jgi:hypothetical protein